MDLINAEDLIFFITKDQLQNEALERIGRKLSFYEINSAKKAIQNGLSFGIDIVFAAAIDSTVEFR